MISSKESLPNELMKNKPHLVIINDCWFWLPSAEKSSRNHVTNPSLLLQCFNCRLF